MNMDTERTHPPAHSLLPAGLRHWLSAGWVSFLAASAALAPSVYLIDYLVEITGGDTRLPVPLSFYTLAFVTLWLCALLACWLLMLLKSKMRDRAPDTDP